MVISEKRNNAKMDVRREYSRVHDRVNREIARRVGLGTSRYRAIADLATDIVNGDFDVNSSPGASQSEVTREPSVLTIRQSVEELQSELLAELNTTRRPVSPLISPHHRRGNPADITNLRNAMRNLNDEFSGRRPADTRREEESDESWRTAALNRVRMLTRSIDSRRSNAEERSRSLNELDNLPPPRDRNIPLYQYNPDTFTTSELTLTQSLNVMSTFDFNKYYNRIKLNLLMYSLKIYGLEECRREDLRLAVFLFIEEHFHFQPVIELCVRPVEDHGGSNVVGVLFERTTAVTQIIKNSHVLSNTRYRVAKNYSPTWIIFNYDG